MTKSELKTGMRVEYRNGESALVMLDTKRGNILCGNHWGEIGSYNDDLTASWKDKEYDIMSVYEQGWAMDMADIRKLGTKIWERNEEPEFEEITADEAMRRLEESSGKKIKITR